MRRYGTERERTRQNATERDGTRWNATERDGTGRGSGQLPALVAVGPGRAEGTTDRAKSMKALSTFWFVLALVSKNLIPYSLASSVPRAVGTAYRGRDERARGVEDETSGVEDEAREDAESRADKVLPAMPTLYATGDAPPCTPRPTRPTLLAPP